MIICVLVIKYWFGIPKGRYTGIKNGLLFLLLNFERTNVWPELGATNHINLTLKHQYYYLKTYKGLLTDLTRA